MGTESRLRIIIKQLRRFLDDQAWLENHRIMELIKAIEKKTITIKDDVPSEKNFASANQVKPILELPMSRSLFTPPCGVRLDEITVEDGSSDITADLLYEQIYVDKELLLQRIRRMLQPRIQISLSEVINRMIGYVRDNDLDYAKHAVNNALKKNVPQLGLHKPEQLNPSRLLPEESRCVETRHHISNHFFTIFHFFLAYDLSTLSK